MTELEQLFASSPRILGNLDSILVGLGAIIIIVATGILAYHWKRYAYSTTIVPMAILYAGGLILLVLIGLKIASTINLP